MSVSLENLYFYALLIFSVHMEIGEPWLSIIVTVAGVLILSGWVQQLVKGYRTKSLKDISRVSFVAYFGRRYPVADLRLCCRGCFHYRYECCSYCPNAYCIHYEETI